MKTLIVYSSKYGTTKKCAEKLKTFLKADMYCCDCKADIDLNNYDRIILGTSVYMGQPRKNIKKYIKTHLDVLSNKVCGLFVCSKESKNYEELFKPLPLSTTTTVGHFGYELYTTRMRGIDKFVTKKITGALQDVYDLDTNAITTFINSLSK